MIVTVAGSRSSDQISLCVTASSLPGKARRRA
jgi:hypothetical protein